MRQSAESGRATDVANFGLVRPPIVYLTSILVGLAIDLVSPLPFLPDAISVLLGIVVIGGAIGLFAYAVTMFQNAGTPVPGNLPTTTIVRDGPYRYSRNPIYVAFSLLQLGHRPLREQPLGRRHGRRRDRAHGVRRHPARGALPRATVRRRIPEVPGVGPAVGLRPRPPALAPETAVHPSLWAPAEVRARVPERYPREPGRSHGSRGKVDLDVGDTGGGSYGSTSISVTVIDCKTAPPIPTP